MDPDLEYLYFQLSPELQALYDALVYTDEDIEELAQILYEQKLLAYEAGLLELSQEFGENEEVDEAKAAWILLQAREEAAGIAETFANDLLRFLYKLNQEDVDEEELESRVTFWNTQRSAYKNPMIALHNILEWAAKAIVAYFVARPHLPAYAELLPKVPVVCEVCQYYVGIGKVPLSSVIDVIADWPPHLNCIHSWKVTRL